GVQVLPGNSVVAAKVARGGLLVGVTDTDDFLAQRKKSGGIDTWSARGTPIPGSVAILQNAPHRQAAQRLVDALVSYETERLLAQQMPGVTSASLTVTSGVKIDGLLPVYEPSLTHISAARWPDAWDKIREPLAEILLSD
ncbi:MAG TPA: hypothetical protein VNA16_01735, partial [Abditibacteriaceae bacterium]|nr:hypothetical protein [Abditibacteriaceae bacterium]